MTRPYNPDGMLENNAPEETLDDVVEELAAAELPRPKPRRRALGALFALLFGCALLGMIAAASYAGFQDGNKVLRAQATSTTSAQIADWFDRGLDAMRAGNPAQAEVYLAGVLKYNPTNRGVAGLIATAQFMQTPTPVPPTPTPVPVTTDKNELLAQMDAAVAGKTWDKVVSITDQLRALDVNFEKTRVTTARYTALVTRGVTRLNEGQIEAGLLDLDFAASLKPLDAYTDSVRRTAAQYQNAKNYMGADWDRAIDLLGAVFRANPNYRDTRALLTEAYLGSGDANAGGQNWCPAQERYAAALAITPNAKTEQKRADAAAKCALATPVPITATTGAGVGVAGVNGRLAFGVFEGNTYQLYLFDSASGRTAPLAAGASQPMFQYGGNVLAYSAGGVLRGYTRQGTFVGLGSGIGYWPSLSPDGRRVAYAAVEGNGYAIFVAPVDGSSAPVKLGAGSFPAWGPTGLIAFQGCASQGCGIHIINPDNPADVRRMTESQGDINPAWSPNGQEIAYVSNVSGGWDVYAFTMSKAFRKLASTGAQASAPAWSPDGSQVAYQSNREGSWAIYVVGSGGGDSRRLVNLGAQHPNWQLERMSWSP